MRGSRRRIHRLCTVPLEEVINEGESEAENRGPIGKPYFVTFTTCLWPVLSGGFKRIYLLLVF